MRVQGGNATGFGDGVRDDEQIDEMQHARNLSLIDLPEQYRTSRNYPCLTGTDISVSSFHRRSGHASKIIVITRQACD